MAVPESNGRTVLITGINGYIASVLGQLVLSKGYSLRGTSRSAKSVEPLISGAYATYRERVQIVEVPDMTADGAFDKAVQDSALKFAGPQLVSVVVTSSAAALTSPNPPTEFVFTEADHNTWAIPAAKTVTDDWPQDKAAGLMYAASKAAADEAMWKWREEQKPFFSMSSIHPGVVIGPPAYLPLTPEKLNESLRPVYTIWAGTSPTLPPPIGTASYVDVRDVAISHLWCIEHPDKADGERFANSAGYGLSQGIADMLRQHYPEDKRIAVGKPGEGYNEGIGFGGEKVKVWFPPQNARVGGRKCVKVMGISWIPLEQSAVDTVEAFAKQYGRD